MRTLGPAFALCLAAIPAQSEEPPAPGTSADEGFSLIEEGAKIILRSLLDDVEPKMKELQKGLGEALAGMEPAIRGLLMRIDDFRSYHPPEVLPNGDIIIRRKSPAELRAPAPGAAIDL